MLSYLFFSLNVVSYKAYCGVAQGEMYSAPSEIQSV